MKKAPDFNTATLAFLAANGEARVVTIIKGIEPKLGRRVSIAETFLKMERLEDLGQVSSRRIGNVPHFKITEGGKRVRVASAAGSSQSVPGHTGPAMPRPA